MHTFQTENIISHIITLAAQVQIYNLQHNHETAVVNTQYMMANGCIAKEGVAVLTSVHPSF